MDKNKPITTTQKPRKWCMRKHALCCIECEKPFKHGDLVYEDVALTIHVGCLALYHASCKELGIL